MSRFRRWSTSMAALVASVAAIGACESSSAPSEIRPTLVGRIDAVHAHDGRVSVRVSALASPASAYDAIVLHVRQPGWAPPIHLRRADGGVERGDVGALRVGAWLEAATTGVELRSDPPQWTATRVVVDLRP